MKIRPITEKDITGCAQLYMQVFSAKPWNELWKQEEAETRLLHLFQSQGYIGLLSHSDDGKIAGFVAGNWEPYRSQSFF